MIRHMNGFDVSDGDGVQAHYTPLVPFLQAGLIAGRDNKGKAFWMFNPGGAEDIYKLPLGVRPRFNLGIDLAFFNSSTSRSLADVDFIRVYDHSGACVFSLSTRSSDGRILARQGTTPAGGLLLDTSTNTVQATSSALGDQPIWGLCELQIGSGSYEVHWDGTQILFGSHSALNNIDTVAFMVATSAGVGGLAVDNYWVLDDQAGLTGFIGRSRVTTMLMQAVVGADRWQPGGAYTTLVAVSEAGPSGFFPDGDDSFITPATVGAVQQYQVIKPACYGRIFGLALNMVAKPTGFNATLNGKIRRGTNIYQMGAATIIQPTVYPVGHAAMAGYSCAQAIAELNPENGLIWNDGDLVNSFYGVEADTTGVRLTQLYLEKLVSLDPARTFNCGQGLYVF